LTSDGFTPYISAVKLLLRDRVDFAQLIKVYGTPRDGEQRYSPAEVVDSVPVEIMGRPVMDRICTSHIERQNLSVRMGMRRMTPVDEWLLKEVGEPGRGLCALVRLLQLLPGSQDAESDPCDGSRGYGPHLHNSRTHRLTATGVPSLMGKWAIESAQIVSEAEKARNLGALRVQRDDHIKDVEGPGLFEQLAGYIQTEVDAYNQIRRNRELTVSVTPVAFTPEPDYERTIIVGRADRRNQSLEITYSTTTHRIRYECGKEKKGVFILGVSDDREPRFETSHHIIKSIEEIGDELLITLRGSLI
jgi:hypothetical protein